MRSPILSRLDPRRNLRARVGLAFGGSALVLALLLSIVVGELTRNRLERASSVRLGERDLQLPDGHGNDDVSSLAHSVHDMIAELADRERDLLTLNLTLEDRVRERTREARTLALVARHTDNAVIVTGADHQIQWVNLGFSRLTGYTLEDAIGRRPGELLGVAADDVDAATPTALLLPTGTQNGHTIEHGWRTRVGEERWVAVEYQSILGDDGAITNYALIGRDVSANRAAEEQLRYDALHDALTGLPNRALFMDQLSHAIRRARRDPAPRFAVLFVDLDGFKKVNDTFGHAIGDLLLVGTARRLEACLRPGDTVARLGGDEMAVLLEAPGPVEEAQRVAERILEQLAQPFELEGNRASVGASIGIAAGYDQSMTADAVLRNADAAMYAAKHRGKGQWVLFSDLDAELQKSA